MKMTLDELWTFAYANDLESVKALLKKYIDEGQPDTFCPYASSRVMCRVASAGLEGVKDDSIMRPYCETKHGVDLYWHMWGSK